MSFSSNVLWLRRLRLSFPEGSGRGRPLGLSDGRTGRLSPAFAQRRIGREASFAGRRGGVSGRFPSNRAVRWAGIVYVQYPETIAGGLRWTAGLSDGSLREDREGGPVV